MLKIRVHAWNPNGTNDIEIIKDGVVVDAACEALFGLDLGNADSKIVPLKKVMKYVAVSPVSDGSQFYKLIRKHY